MYSRPSLAEFAGTREVGDDGGPDERRERFAGDERPELAQPRAARPGRPEAHAFDRSHFERHVEGVVLVFRDRRVPRGRQWGVVDRSLALAQVEGRAACDVDTTDLDECVDHADPSTGADERRR